LDSLNGAEEEWLMPHENEEHVNVAREDAGIGETEKPTEGWIDMEETPMAGNTAEVKGNVFDVHPIRDPPLRVFRPWSSYDEFPQALTDRLGLHRPDGVSVESYDPTFGSEIS
jgi:hypothetical protein